MYPFFTRFAAILLMLSLAVASNAQSNDSVPPEQVKSGNIFKKIGDYFSRSNDEVEPGKFDITFIGGPHYSEEKQFGIGLLAAGVYRPKGDYLTPPSNVSLFGDVATVGFYELGIMGNHIMRNDKARINYEGYFYSFPSYFWGVGYDADSNNDNKTKFDKRKVQIKAEWLWQVYPRLFIGPGIEFSYYGAVKMRSPKPWEGYAPKTYSYGLSATLSYDTRDNLTAPKKGIFLMATAKTFPSFLFNKIPFSNFEVTVSGYARLWKGATLAARLHTMLSAGENIPWGMLPSFGGSYNMRGYYDGRYCDRNESDITLELRQNIWRRSGAVAWVGAGEVFPDFKSFTSKAILPSAGVGYRWEFKKNINIRFDYGVGRRSSNFIFSINEAF